MSEVNTLTIQEEENIIARAMAEWNAQHVQVLIDDDSIPKNAHYLPLESLIEFLESQKVPTKVIVSGENYIIKLRKYVSWNDFRDFRDGLIKFLRQGQWIAPDYRKGKGFIVKRWR
jgi:hypothetical protein